jgi:hypothetical protein
MPYNCIIIFGLHFVIHVFLSMKSCIFVSYFPAKGPRGFNIAFVRQILTDEFMNKLGLRQWGVEVSHIRLSNVFQHNLLLCLEMSQYMACW